MITDAQWLAWLKDDGAMRCLLIEAGVMVDGVETTRYMSDMGYVTNPTETPANTSYEKVLSGSIRLSESVSLDGNATMSYGDVEIFNTSGEKDSWLSDVWTNRPLVAYFGDVRWPREDFRMVFNGVSAGIYPKARNLHGLKLRDKLQRLNTPASEVKLGGTSSNKDRVIPLTFGEVHNVEPLLVDEANHEYQVHLGPIESIIEVRANGVPVSFTPTLTSGKFRLNTQPYGTITCSVQGSKPSTYSNTVSGLVQQLATNYGKEADRFTSGDLDTDNLSAFDTDNPQPVGLYASDRLNVLQACQQVAASVGAQVTTSRAGLFKLIRIDFPPTGTPRVINGYNYVEQSLKLVDLPDVVASVKLGFCKNWTVQTDLDTGLPEEHKAMFAEEWLTVTKTDAATATNYRLHSDPEQEDTLLIVEADADDEATRRLNLRKTQRRVYELEGLPELLDLELGQAVELYGSRYSLEAGKLGVVVNLEPNWSQSSVKVQVMV
jgi:hypothetical protein